MATPTVAGNDENPKWRKVMSRSEPIVCSLVQEVFAVETMSIE